MTERAIAPWPLTGRAAQLEELGRHYRDPERAGVMLHGAAGVGKTRLAEEALHLAERSGRRVERAVGHPATQEIPLGALAHLLPPDVTAPVGVGVGEDDRAGLFHAARAELRRLAGEDRLVLLVDDLDLLDDVSAAVLVPLVVARTVFLVGTVRSGRSPSARLGALERDRHLVRMEIGPLDPEELGALLHRVLDGPVAETARLELARLSMGNLQVLSELVRGARERGALVERDGVWQLSGPLPTTAALDELVTDHLARVDPAARAVLELLAVCERFDLADLEARHPAAILEALEADGLIGTVTTDDGLAVRLAHPIYGEVLRARMPPLRLRRIQGELADMIEARGARRRDDVLRLAIWRVASGGDLSADTLQRAARLALLGHDAALTIDLVTNARAPDLPAADRAELLVEAHATRGDVDAVEQLIADVWDDDLADARRAHLAMRLAETRFYGNKDLEGALAAHEAARARVSDREVLAMIDARRATLLAGAGRAAEALEVIDGVGDVASARTRVVLAGARAMSLLSLGRYEEARTLARRAAVEHAALPEWAARRGIAQHVVTEAHALAYSGRYREAREVLEPAADRARTTGALGAWVWFQLGLGEVARDTGRGGEAIQRFAAAAEVAPQVGQHAALVWAHVGVAQGHLLLGQCDEAAVALARADAVGDSPVATSMTTHEQTRAWLDAGRGDLESARRRIRDLIPVVRADGILIFELALYHDLVRLGAAAEAVEQVKSLATGVDGPLAPIFVDHAVALVERDVTTLHEVVSRYEELDVLQLAAEVAAELADLHRSRAESRLATAAAQRSAELAARCGGLRTPALARGFGVEPLTAREREVALLAAGGRRSRDIGDRLGMSTRTVDTHLARVYRKLGITGREELAAALDG